jgi:pimeloyl-ACP methyl ester carboxylesterase
MRTTTVQIKDDEWTLDEGGSGPCVLALHGIPGWRGTWREVARQLGDGVRVVAPDLLGFGASRTRRSGMHAAEHAQALAELLDALDVRRVHVVGFDFGGPIAAHLHALRPRAFASLTLAATNVLPDTPVPGPLRVARVPVLGDLCFRAFFGRTGLRAMHRFAARDRVAFPRARFEEGLASDDGVRSTREVFLASLCDLRRLYTPVAAAIANVRVPTTVVWGDHDPFFSVDTGRKTAALIPGARFVVAPGCGHFVPEERAALLAEEILALVRRAAA